jgi:glycerophosphoryl diester phosphodiesterase
MKKLRKFLTILTTVLVVIAVAWFIISLIPPKAAVEGDNPWRKTDQTLISAHRGGANLNPENTEMAFDYVINETTYTDIVEIDIRVTKDNELVIIHDDSINRTGIKGEVDNDNLLLINDLTYDELVQYNLGVNFEKDGVKPYENLTTKEAEEKGLTIMKFEEFLIKYQSSRYFRLLLEIKDSKELGVKAVDMAEDIIAKYADWDERIMIISFSTDVVNHVLANYKDRYVAGMGYNMVTFLIGSVLNLDCLFNIKYHSVQSSMITKAGPISIDCATQSFVDSVHARNQCVAFWTINEEADMRYLVSLGVDVITTNSPDVLAKVLGKI